MSESPITLEEKQNYLEEVKKLREMIRSGEYSRCPCPKTKCEWHGQCFECVMIHRYHRDHVPCCLQPLLRGWIAGLARAAELNIEPKPLRPGEYWDYINEVCPPEIKR
jgi:hypothetical protein